MHYSSFEAITVPTQSLSASTRPHYSKLTFCRAALQSNCSPSCVTSIGRSNGVETNSPSSLLNWAKILFSPASCSLVDPSSASCVSAIFPLQCHVVEVVMKLARLVACACIIGLWPSRGCVIRPAGRSMMKTIKSYWCAVTLSWCLVLSCTVRCSTPLVHKCIHQSLAAQATDPSRVSGPMAWLPSMGDSLDWIRLIVHPWGDLWYDTDTTRSVAVHMQSLFHCLFGLADYLCCCTWAWRWSHCKAAICYSPICNSCSFWSDN